MNTRDEAISLFCRLRRLQEATDNGYVTCITCGKVVRWDECDGGHMIPRRHRGTEVEPDNVWPQCIKCNRFGTIDIVTYGEKLIEKIGFDRVASLMGKKHDYVKHDYEALKKEYNSEIRKLLKTKGL